MFMVGCTLAVGVCWLGLLLVSFPKTKKERAKVSVRPGTLSPTKKQEKVVSLEICVAVLAGFVGSVPKKRSREDTSVCAQLSGGCCF